VISLTGQISAYLPAVSEDFSEAKIVWGFGCQ
jgi:hypothetical protein